MPEPLKDIYKSAIIELESYTTHGAPHKESVKTIRGKMKKAPEQNSLPILITELSTIPLEDAEIQKIMETIIDSLLDATPVKDALLILLDALSVLNTALTAHALLKTSTTRKGWNALFFAICFSPNRVADLLKTINTLAPEQKEQIFLQTVITKNPQDFFNGLNVLMLTACRYPQGIVPMLAVIRTLDEEKQKNILNQTNKDGFDALECSRDKTEAYYPLEQLYREHGLVYNVNIGKHRKDKGASPSSSTDFFHEDKAPKPKHRTADNISQGESSTPTTIPRAGC